MERGAEMVEERTDLGSTVDRLLENTEDAYTFPPFAWLAPFLRFGGRGVDALRDREREILCDAVGHAQTMGLRVTDHQWAEIIPQLIESAPGAPIAVR
jgi:hypothetical protein